VTPRPASDRLIDGRPIDTESFGQNGDSNALLYQHPSFPNPILREPSTSMAFPYRALPHEQPVLDGVCHVLWMRYPLNVCRDIVSLDAIFMVNLMSLRTRSNESQRNGNVNH